MGRSLDHPGKYHGFSDEIGTAEIFEPVPSDESTLGPRHDVELIVPSFFLQLVDVGGQACRVALDGHIGAGGRIVWLPCHEAMNV